MARLRLACCLLLLSAAILARSESPTDEQVEAAGERAAESEEAEEAKERERADEIKDDDNSEKGPFAHVSGFMGSSKDACDMSRPAMVVQKTLDELCERFHMSKEEVQDMITSGSMAKVLEDEDEDDDKCDCVCDGQKKKKKKNKKCPHTKKLKCNAKAPYRTIDGSCNNLKQPLWGKAMRAFRRSLTPDYADGYNTPRRAKSGYPLPSSRYVSRTIYEDVSHNSTIATNLHMTYGQFVDHDIDRTAITKLVDGDGDLVDVPCGDDGCNTTGIENAACLPIYVEEDDPIFGDSECLMFVRAAAAVPDNCPTGFREQLNQITSYIDSSMTYGSDDQHALSLRKNSTSTGRGQLDTTPNPKGGKPFLPVRDDPECHNTTNVIKCFVTGDTRTNEQAALSAMHTIFVREHNRIEEALHEVNPHWDGETLYQESRKILNAIWQYVTYAEYLPLLLGIPTMDEFGLTVEEGDEFFEDYDKKLNVDTSTVFATAAFRCGHSQVTNEVLVQNAHFTAGFNINLANLFFRPAIHYQNTSAGCGMTALMRGQIDQPAEGLDRFFAASIKDHMFTLTPPFGPGTDLPALNTQRGRDMGLPGYNAWRKFCYLSEADDFYDMEDIPADVQAKFHDIYEHVDDVDLFPAAMSERPLPGAMVGPTFACLLADQFMRYKYADRYWFDRKDKKVGMTIEQIKEIRKATYARLMCDNLDEMEYTQKFVMMLPLSDTTLTDDDPLMEFYTREDDDNERRSCDDPSIPGIDFSHWKD